MTPRADPEALAEQLLGVPLASLDEEEQEVIRRVAGGKFVGLDASEAARAEASLGDRLADRVAAIGGSWAFIGAFVVVMALWMTINGLRVAGIDFDPYPFILLNLALSTLAALQAPVILMSQNRQAAKDRIAARHDYEVNLRTQLEIVRLSRKLDRVMHLAIREAKRAEELVEETRSGK